MKFNRNIFYFPPYISAAWANIAALHMEGQTLVVTLFDGKRVEIPSVPEQLLGLIFEAHAEFLESSRPAPQAEPPSDGVVRFGIGAMDAWGTALQHDPEQADIPNLPEELLDKIRGITKIIGPADPELAPKAEEGCNCLYCQIARAIHETIPAEQPPTPSVKELPFQRWEIAETAEPKLYLVTNREDRTDQYNVYLGTPVGCTCGIRGCEHILAVLKS